MVSPLPLEVHQTKGVAGFPPIDHCLDNFRDHFDTALRRSLIVALAYANARQLERFCGINIVDRFEKSLINNAIIMKAMIASRSLLNRVPNMLLGKSLTAGTSIQEVPIPKIANNELLIRVNTIALSPIDFKLIEFIVPPGSKLGCDFTGVVSEVGSAASSRWKVGDRVASFVQGGICPEYGAFAEYVRAESDLVWKVPQEIRTRMPQSLEFQLILRRKFSVASLAYPIPEEVMDGDCGESFGYDLKGHGMIGGKSRYSGQWSCKSRRSTELE